MNQAGPINLGGSIEGVRLPQHFDFNELRLSPAQLREKMDALNWSRFIAFQTRNPMHRAHIELTRLAANEQNLGVLIHPVAGMTKPGDVDYSVRVRCYQAIVHSGSYYKKGGVELSLLPIAMRMAGPREALWHAIIRKNYGASHFIVGRDHAGCKSDITGQDFYGMCSPRHGSRVCVCGGGGEDGGRKGRGDGRVGAPCICSRVHLHHGHS